MAPRTGRPQMDLQTKTPRPPLHQGRRTGGGAAPGPAAGLEDLAEDLLRVLGPDHPATIITKHHAAIWRGEAGNPDGAATALQELLTDYLRVFGPDHPIPSSPGATWPAGGHAGNPAGAVTVLEEVLQDQLRALGPDHSDTLTTRTDLEYWQEKAGQSQNNSGYV
jgi:hypothetical protein